MTKKDKRADDSCADARTRSIRTFVSTSSENGASRDGETPGYGTTTFGETYVALSAAWYSPNSALMPSNSFFTAAR